MNTPSNMKKPDCYECAHRRDIPGDCHIQCANKSADVTGNPVGIRHGWFEWPFNFDPTWLSSCNGFQPKDK